MNGSLRMSAPLSNAQLPRGFTFAATHCGLKKSRLDLGTSPQRSSRRRRGHLHHQSSASRAGTLSARRT